MDQLSFMHINMYFSDKDKECLLSNKIGNVYWLEGICLAHDNRTGQLIACRYSAAPV